MKNTITRYTRTFVQMEMCNTGHWCEFPEVEEVIDKIEQHSINLLEECRIREDNLNAKNWGQTKKIWTLEYIKETLIILLTSSFLINLYFAITIYA